MASPDLSQYQSPEALGGGWESLGGGGAGGKPFDLSQYGYSYTENPLNDIQRKLDPIGGALFGGLFGGSKKSRAPYYKRLANREWAQGNAVLSAFTSLYEPTLALARRSAADYGDLWRRASNEQLSHELKSITAKRTGDLADYAKLGPEYIRMMRESNPILGDLYDSAQNEWKLGTQFDPGMESELENQIRQGQAARGMGLGPADVYQEALQKSEFGQRLKQGRRANAMDAAGLFGDVFQATTGRPAQSPAPQGTGIEAPKVGTNWDDLLSYGVNREIQGRNLSAAKDNANKQMWGQIIGGLLGAAGGAAGACWVARAVFGVHNPKWRMFRVWLFTRAPEKFRSWYIQHGERFAAKLRRRPQTKLRLRRWMEEKIRELDAVFRGRHSEFYL